MALIHEYLSTNLEINIANASHSQIRSGKFFEIMPIFSKLECKAGVSSPPVSTQHVVFKNQF
jgi:hypothetical protein